MAKTTGIEWTGATWSPITGCSLVSEGCRHCYAATLAAGRLQHHPSRAGLARRNAAGEAKFTGEVRFNAQWLDQPLRWKKPSMIFVCAHADLFHEAVPDEWIDQIFAIMALAPRHTFQVLTKRSARMRAYLSDPCVVRRIYELACERVIEERLQVMLMAPGVEDPGICPDAPRIFLDTWPLPNVWLGVSAEDQRRAEERIPDLLEAPAAIRFLSAEPLLGPIDLGRLTGMNDMAWYRQDALRGIYTLGGDEPGDVISTATALLDQVIVGGESGQGARPMHPDWARSLRDQCAAAGVPFFFKQWGSWEPATEERGHHDHDMSRNGASWVHLDGLVNGPCWHRKDGRLDTDPFGMIRVGKKAAGRMLDGIEHNGMPQPREVHAL